MTYSLVKFVHVAAVAITLVLFVLRGLWTLVDSPALRRRWVRTLPHANDTVLLVAALYLASFHGLRPWILAKIAGLVVYIGLGMIALHGKHAQPARIASGIGALLAFGYIVAVAVMRRPLVFAAA